MFDKNVDSFRNMLTIPGNEALKSLWDVTSDRLLAELADQGVTISKAELMGLRSVRTYVALNGTDDSYLMNVRQEIEESLPRLKKARELEEVRQRIEAEDAAAVEEIQSLRPANRMQKARAAGMDLPKRHQGRNDPETTGQKEPTIEDLTRAVQHLSGAERLKAHRALRDLLQADDN
ncbi:hypothetical protein [Pseudoruegeria sp. HB172150]|uniref:hypothetical protein n=1 Tax=Pseudoruegeria sp. HB172150 TaxID=2721164 RepID=UPI0015565CF3|nr:hypothetical protein [Pseudoruegeria sp. HB172150]